MTGDPCDFDLVVWIFVEKLTDVSVKRVRRQLCCFGFGVEDGPYRGCVVGVEVYEVDVEVCV